MADLRRGQSKEELNTEFWSLMEKARSDGDNELVKVLEGYILEGFEPWRGLLTLRHLSEAP